MTSCPDVRGKGDDAWKGGGVRENCNCERSERERATRISVWGHSLYLRAKRAIPKPYFLAYLPGFGRPSLHCPRLEEQARQHLQLEYSRLHQWRRTLESTDNRITVVRGTARKNVIRTKVHAR